MFQLRTRLFAAAVRAFRGSTGFPDDDTNLYSTPMCYIGQILVVRVGTQELTIYDRGIEEIGRHPLFSREVRGQRSTLADHRVRSEGRRQQEELEERFAALGNIRSADLMQDLYSSPADQTLPKRLRYYTKLDYLIIDEFGIDHLKPTMNRQMSSLLYKVIDGRCGKKSTSLVSHMDFPQWSEYLQDGSLTMGLLDRLVDRSIVLRLTGKSYRMQRSEQTSQGNQGKDGGKRKPGRTKP